MAEPKIKVHFQARVSLLTEITFVQHPDLTDSEVDSEVEAL